MGRDSLAWPNSEVKLETMAMLTSSSEPPVMPSLEIRLVSARECFRGYGT